MRVGVGIRLRVYDGLMIFTGVPKLPKFSMDLWVKVK